MERGKFDPRYPKNPEPIVTKVGVGDDVGDTYPCVKFHYNSIRKFLLARPAGARAYKVTS